MMVEKIPICFYLRKDISKGLDEFILRKKYEKGKFPSTRSAVIEEAINYYLKHHAGIPYLVRKKE